MSEETNPPSSRLLAKYWDDLEVRRIAGAHDTFVRILTEESDAWAARRRQLQDQIDEGNRLLAARLRTLAAQETTNGS